MGPGARLATSPAPCAERQRHRRAAQDRKARHTHPGEGRNALGHPGEASPGATPPAAAGLSTDATPACVQPTQPRPEAPPRHWDHARPSAAGLRPPRGGPPRGRDSRSARLRVQHGALHRRRHPPVPDGAESPRWRGMGARRREHGVRGQAQPSLAPGACPSGQGAPPAGADSRGYRKRRTQPSPGRGPPRRSDCTRLGSPAPGRPGAKGEGAISPRHRPKPPRPSASAAMGGRLPQDGPLQRVARTGRPTARRDVPEGPGAGTLARATQPHPW
jgi:hypothetical protein